MIWYWDHMSHPGFLNLTLESYVMHRGLAYWTWVFFAICLPLQKAGFFASDPLTPAEWAAQLSMWDGTVYWNLLCLWGGSQPCRERQPLWNSHDGLNLTCLDQCHRVRSHGKSSSQSWRKRIVMSYNSLNLACSGQHPCFGPNWFVQFCHTWRWIGYA